jgi:5-methylcytosine-specific restriction endonuclease McrA
MRDYTEIDKELIRLTNEDKSATEISKIVNIPRTTVSRRLRGNGIEKRGPYFISKSLSGKPKSIEHRKKLSINRIAKGVAKGERNPNWRGGKQDCWSQLKNSNHYKEWRNFVFARDKYTCKGCGDSRGGNLEAHHILKRSEFPLLTFSTENGITLCTECHKKTFGKEHLFENMWKHTV